MCDGIIRYARRGIEEWANRGPGFILAFAIGVLWFGNILQWLAVGRTRNAGPLLSINIMNLKI